MDYFKIYFNEFIKKNITIAKVDTERMLRSNTKIAQKLTDIYGSDHKKTLKLTNSINQFLGLYRQK